MSSARIAATFLAALAFFSAPTTAHARRGASVPISLRMTAYVNEAPTGQKPQYKWTAEYKSKRYVLHITDIAVVGRGISAADIDRSVNMYPVAFRLAGDSKALTHLTNAAPQQSVAIQGYLRSGGGTRILMLDTAETATSAPKTTP